MIACHRNEPRVYQPSQKEFQLCAQSSSKIRGPWRASVQYLEQFGFGPDWGLQANPPIIQERASNHLLFHIYIYIYIYTHTYTYTYRALALFL
jgi:hypothetical protein